LKGVPATSIAFCFHLWINQIKVKAGGAGSGMLFKGRRGGGKPKIVR
jgi:hypothetical protein